jgi:glycosyltransferase involved in cell wall biosynthesis
VDIVVAGAQVPFMRGGAEMALDNLQAALEAAGHRVEQVRIPTAFDKERSFDSALAWRLAPVDADMVIPVNFPAYFVRHRRKVVWLFHQHRNFYDAVDAPWSDLGHDAASLELRRIMTEWDNRALGEAGHRFAISALVAGRLRRFNGLDAEPLYHPPPLHGRLRSGGELGDYVFCVNRLEQNKRPGPVVDAMAHVRSGTRLALVGQGSLEGALRAHAGDLVDMLGPASDAEVIARYEASLAVVYVPQDEDYGYVTLEAFEAGKPVITAADSGGVLEWVEDGVTGIVTDGTPEGIAAAVDRLAGDRDLARRMGEAGRAKVAGLDWAPVVARLTGAAG